MLKNDIELRDISAAGAQVRVALSAPGRSPIEKHDVGNQSDAEKNTHDPGRVDEVESVF